MGNLLKVNNKNIVLVSSYLTLKYLKLLYSSKGMCWIDGQSKKLVHLKYLVLETPYAFFSIFSWHFSFMHTERFITYVFRF